MFSVVAVLLFAVAGAILLVSGIVAAYRGSADDGHARIGFGIVLLIVALVWAIAAAAGPYTGQLEDFASIKKAKQEVRLYTERRDKLVVVVRVELAKYPEYEKKIMGDIRPEIVLQFPLLKSNETMVKTVEEIVKLEDAVYKIRASIIETQRSIYYREISPWVIYYTPYEKFFGVPNPLVGAK